MFKYCSSVALCGLFVNKQLNYLHLRHCVKIVLKDGIEGFSESPQGSCLGTLLVVNIFQGYIKLAV